MNYIYVFLWFLVGLSVFQAIKETVRKLCIRVSLNFAFMWLWISVLFYLGEPIIQDREAPQVFDSPFALLCSTFLSPICGN